MALWRRLAAGAIALSALHLSGAIGADAARAQAAPSGDRFDGILTTVWGDPHASSGNSGVIRFTLTYPDGKKVALDVPPELQSEAVRQTGKRVSVRGAASAEAVKPRVRADAIEATALQPQAEVTGTRKVLFILLKFKGDSQEPHPPKFFNKLTNPLKPSGEIPATINGFFDKVSYGAFKWSGKVAGDKWYTLSKARTDYANCGSNSACFAPVLDDIAAEALQLVQNAVDVNQFDNINFVFNNDLDCCAWGGGYSNGSRSWGATWEPPWGQNTGIYVHEMGHSLGLPHSGWRYFAYDSGHDQMSRGTVADSVPCGTYNSVLFGGPNTVIDCDEPGGGYIMAHQDHLGWVPDARKATMSNTGTKSYEIEANAKPLSGKLKLVVVCLQGLPCSTTQSNARFITIEVKTLTAKYDRAVPSEGVIIHDVLMNRGPIGGGCYFNSQSGWAVPYDATPGDWNASTCSGAGLSNMAYAVGSTFNDTNLGVKIEVVKKSGDVYKVKVTKSK